MNGSGAGECAAMLGHVLVDGVQKRLDISGTLGIAGQLELTGRIDGYEDHGCQDGDDADDDQDFDESEAF